MHINYASLMFHRNCFLFTSDFAEFEGLQVQLWCFCDVQITVGRGVDVTYQLLSPSCPLMISRLHCTFKQTEDGSWTVTDKKVNEFLRLTLNMAPCVTFCRLYSIDKRDQWNHGRWYLYFIDCIFPYNVLCFQDILNYTVMLGLHTLSESWCGLIHFIDSSNLKKS